VAGAFLDLVERDLQHYLRRDVKHATLPFDRDPLEQLGEFSDLRVGHTAKGFANVDEHRTVLSWFPIPHGKRIVAERIPPLAVAELGGGDDTVERGQVRFELQPRLPAPAGRVERGGVFKDKPFIAAIAGGGEGGFDLLGGGKFDGCRFLHGELS
jgi:hypothetical protein